MARKKSAMDWWIVIGVTLVSTCILHSVISMLLNLATNKGPAMLADILCAVAEIAIVALVGIYYGDEEMYHFPAVAFIVFNAANMIRVFGTHWAYILYAGSVALIVLMILNEWNMWGMAAGAAMFLTNIIVTVIVYYTTHPILRFSTYFCSNLVNNISLMGIACVLFYLKIRQKPRTKINPYGNNNPGGFGGGSSTGGGMNW